MTPFQKVASEVLENIIKRTAADRDAEWHRVNSSIADILKDCSMLFSKLARLQSDFVGSELEQLEDVSDKVLTLGQEMAQFARSFYEGDFAMNPSETVYGNPQVQPGQQPAQPQIPAQPTQVFQPPVGAAPPPVIPEFETPLEEDETEEEDEKESKKK